MVLRVWASTGFHPASPGPAMAPATRSITGLPAGSLRTLLPIRRDEPLSFLKKEVCRLQRQGIVEPDFEIGDAVAGCFELEERAAGSNGAHLPSR